MKSTRPASETSIAALAFLLSISSSQGVIVAGANGGGNTSNNTTRAQLETQQGRPAAFYDNVINYSDATGIYLGYNPGNSSVWVMSAKHVTSNTSNLTIAGLSYVFQQEINLASGDVRLIRYSRADNAVPSLGAVKLATTVPVANQSLVLLGIGQNRTENAATVAAVPDSTSTGTGTGYHWDGTRIKRFGTNVVEAEFPNNLETDPMNPASGTLGPANFLGSTTAFYTDFDQPPGGGYLTSNESTGSLGDSGGGAFRFNGTEYELAGIFSAVTTFGGQDGPPTFTGSSAFGNGSILTDISTYRSAILLETGTLIPEPTAMSLLGAGLILLTMRRKR